MSHPNDQPDGFYEGNDQTFYCSAESDGSFCRCGGTVKKQAPMGPVHSHQRTVVELSTMPYGMRLARGFAILSGNKRDL